VSFVKVDLEKYNNEHYYPGGGPVIRFFWFIINAAVFKSYFFPFNFIKVFFLRMFGAKVGRGVTIKPCVNIKYPWFVKIGNHVWIGEEVWIDSLATIEIGDHVCLSQGAMLLTGNHDYTKSSFDLVVKKITIENGTWIGAKSVVCPGVICQHHSVLSVSSVATKNLEPHGIYQGNPAVKIKTREINS